MIDVNQSHSLFLRTLTTKPKSNKFIFIPGFRIHDIVNAFEKVWSFVRWSFPAVEFSESLEGVCTKTCCCLNPHQSQNQEEAKTIKIMAASVASPYNELDVMLSDLSKGHYAASNSNDYSAYSDFGSFTKGTSPTSPPNRPPPPKSYKATVSVRSERSEMPSTVPTQLRRPPKPPKLQHVLIGGNRSHDLVKAQPR